MLLYISLAILFFFSISGAEVSSDNYEGLSYGGSYPSRLNNQSLIDSLHRLTEKSNRGHRKGTFSIQETDEPITYVQYALNNEQPTTVATVEEEMEGEKKLPKYTVKGTAPLKVELHTERYVLWNESASLNCDYNVPLEYIYMVEWQLGRNKVAQYIDKPEPHYEPCPFPGAVVDVSLGSPNLTVIHYAELDASGNYSCSVTTYPFKNVSKVSTTKEVTIVVPQSARPILTVSSSHYKVGDLLSGECKSAPAHPPPSLTFLINGNPVPKSFVISFSRRHMVSRTLHLYFSRALLNIHVKSTDIRNGSQLYLKCISSIPDFLGVDSLPEEYADYTKIEMTVNVTGQPAQPNYSSKADGRMMSSAGLLLVITHRLAWKLTF